MPDFIRLLPESIANQIAAGEVVQRPASVVKELIENSLDAGSTGITLIFKDGGQTSIQVIDNGKGMSDTDARMCWERHATSKIREANDLFHLTTYGFRGEALASIASIAQVEMKTKLDTETLGTRIVIEAGEVKKQEPVNLLKGTSITVKNLFFNIPVRRNFLKSVSAETRYIIEEFQRCALSRPDVEMTLMNGQHEVYTLHKTNLKQRILDVLTASRKGELLEVEELTEIVNITGYLGSPEKARKSRGDQFLFVNGRYIREPYFHHAVAGAFNGLIESEFHPFYVLFLEVDPGKIDVNVHPTKTEVKFEDGRAMYSIIQSVAKKALGTYHASPLLDPTPGVYTDRNFDHINLRQGSSFPPETKSKAGYNPFLETPAKRKEVTQWEKLYEPFRDEGLNTRTESPKTQPQLLNTDEVRLGKVFQIQNRFLVADINGSLCVINQQLAHERVLYEKYLHQLNQGKTPSQQLLFPRTIELSASDYTTLMDMRGDLEMLGFDLDSFGKNTIIVNGTPADLAKGEERDLLEGLLESYKHHEASLKGDKKDNLARSLARNACLKGGNPLADDMIQTLIRELFQCSHPGHSPSGRPVMVSFGREQLDGFYTR